MNRAQRVVLALALFAMLGFVGFALLPMGGGCGVPSKAILERSTVRTDHFWGTTGRVTLLGAGHPTGCAIEAGARFRIAAIVGGLAAVGLVGSFRILRDRPN